MNNIVELLQEVTQKEIGLSAEGDELVVQAKKGVLDSLILARLREHKQELIDVLREKEKHEPTSNSSLLGGGAASLEAMLPLVQLSEEEIDRIVTGVPGGVSNLQDIYPLAPLQEGILFHHLMGGEGDPYLLASEIGFEDRSKMDDFVAALQAVIQRHDILRTAIWWEGLSEPVQVVWREAVLPVEEVELDTSSGSVAEQLYARFDPRRHRIDIRQAPLFRVYVAQDRSTGGWLMMLLHHHLVGDHTTVEEILKEVRAHLLGQADRLPAPLSFRNLVAQTRMGMSREEHESFFKRLLGDVEEPTAPFGLLEVRGDGRGIDQALLEVEGELARRLRKRARELEVSAASLCHLAWGQVLAKVTGRQDVVFGTVLFGRMQGGEGSDRVMGPFINTLPMRIRIGEQETEAGVRQTHELLADLLRHEHASLALAQRCSRVPAPMPLFTALLNYRHSLGELRKPEQADQFAWNGMQVLGGEERTNYPFTLSVDDLGEELQLTAQVAGSISAMRICVFMHTALESLVTALETAPATPLHSLAVLAASERHQVLYEWNDTRAEYPLERCVHQLFEEQVVKSTEAVAVEFAEQSLSYGELNRRSNQLAHYLRQLGVKPDDRVGICVERGVELVVGLLGILKAGGAYVPLDPGYPAERLRFMVEDSEPVALLTQSDLVGLFGGLEQKLPVLELAGAGCAWSQEKESNPDPTEAGLSSRHLAYVIYTSGSSGTPKGVMVEHRQIVSRLLGIQQSLSFSGEDRMPNVSSIAFDISLLELLLPLVSGGQTVLTDAAGIRDMGYLVERTRSATVFNAVTSLMDVWHQHLWGEDTGELYPKLRSLLVGGEPVSHRLLDELSAQFSEVEIVETYGPTESALYCTSCRGYGASGSESSPPIGRPIANTRVYILDGYGEPVPVGVSGELYIGGAGVARGYLNRAAMTEEKFVQDPFAGEAESRMYRTGDLGRWLADGNIEFLGRSDFQVKIRGFRIELGEIEARLQEHGGVREAVVLAREDVPGEKRLVAYYTVADTDRGALEAPEAEQLRGHLSGMLPEYMVPAAYVRLESLPLTPNGKLDRRGLPAPEQSAYSVSGYEAPQGEAEVLLAEIWAELLHLDRVGRHDNFFSLGGHSLLAVRVVTRVRQQMGVEVAIRDLFTRPVLADLALAVESGAWAELPPITRTERDRGLPLSFAQQRLWFLAQMEGGSQAYHLPLGLRLLGCLEGGVLRRALDRILFRHEALRTTFVSIDGEPVQQIAAAEDSRFLLLEHDLRGSSDVQKELERLNALETRVSFDLERGPLIRGRLIRLAEEEHALLVTMHHIVSDGWSMGVLVNELSALYGSFLRGEADPLPILEIQYADYAVWQRQWIKSEALQQQAAYWKTALAGAPPLLELPGDRARPAQQDFKGGIVELVLDEQLTAGLRVLSKKHGTTLFMTLLAAWAALLARLSGQQDVVIGAPAANRRRMEIERLIGFFVNTLAIRLDLSGSPTVGELLQRVKTQALAAQQHQDIPFEQVVELLQPARSLAHSPIFQVMFAWQNNEQGVLELPGLELRPLESSPHTVTKFDLMISLQEAANTVIGGVEYSNSLFGRATIERYLGYFRNLIGAMVTDDTQIVDRLPILGASERRQVLYEWNDTRVEYPSDKCVHQLFEEQVVKSPEAVAVVFREQSLSYRELNRRANQLAHYLRQLGVRPDDRVAICVERSLEMIVGLLGVLKAGGAYVPLDPAYPVARLHFMLEDSGPLALLTQSHLRELLATPDRSLPVLELDDAEAPWLQEAETDPVPGAVGLTSLHLAYVIYTSGSTGTPKGVSMANKSLVNLLCWQMARSNSCVSQRALQFAAFGFDVATQEIFSTICSGATLNFIDEEKRLHSSEFIGYVREKHIDRVILPYAALQVLTEGLGSHKERFGEKAYENFPLKEIIVAGEQLRIDPKVATFFRYFKASRLENQYGPTESHCVCSFKLPSDVDHWPMLPPIGRPIANAYIYILDGQGEPVPVGVVGELYIGGVGVARGYLNRPELTAEKFLRDRFVNEPGAQMYRTGDLGRWLADGNIEFLGRNDFQVKIRGFRIELGEIEARLLEHSGVKEAVVLAREDTPGEKRLVAYYTVADTNRAAWEAPDTEQLRAHLLGLLPEHMVPAAYVRLESLPLSPNGKLDRRALPAPGGDAYGTRVYEPPIGETEILLAAFWAELLKLDRVGRHDNFFSLGGHSLLAVSLIERMRRHGFTADVRTVFATPTVAQMAATMDAGAAVRVPPNLIPPHSEIITPQMLPLVRLSQEEIDRIVAGVPGGAGNVQDIYPLAPLQEGILFHHLMGGEGDPYLLASVMGFADRSKMADFLSALQAVIQRHDILRTAIWWEGLSEPAQVVWRQAVLPVEEVELDAPAGIVAEQLYARFDPRRHRIDIRQAPLFRVYVTPDGSTGGWLILLLHHHLVGDHTTLEAMQAEVRSILLGEADRLPAPLPFRNLVAQTRLGISREEHERFFKRLLGDVEEPTTPFGLLDVQGDGSDIEAVRLPLDSDLARRLRDNARRLGVSAASMCHLAWARVLSKVSGREDVVFGTVLFGRMQGGEGSDQVMGLFINTLPVRILIDDEGVENGVRRTHALLAELMRHEHASLTLAQRCSAVPAPAPLFSALLNYRHTPDAAETHSDDALQAWKGISRIRGEERTNYPFMLSINDHGKDFSLVAQTSSTLRPMRICEFMHTALESLVHALEVAPAIPVRALEVLTESERRQVLYEWNDTRVEYPSDKCVHQLFEEQVAKSPEAVAVVFREQSLSYRELNRRANQLAHYLRQLGVRPDDRVAICVERSLEMIVGLLGVLKAGGAYVPLDPAYPVARLHFMLEDSGPLALLTQSHLRELLAAPDRSLPVLELDDAEAPWLQEAETDPVPGAVGLTSLHLAYVIYTSGSTGTPKGVSMANKSLVNLLCWQMARSNSCVSQRALQFAAFGFDVATQEIFSTICSGATLNFIDEEKRLHSSEFIGYVREKHIDRVILPYAALQVLTEGLGSHKERFGEKAYENFPLKEIIVAGEQLRIDPKVATFFRYFKASRLENQYGPTESHCVCSFKLPSDVDHWPMLPPIGRPIANAHIYILDGQGEPVPVGVVGELYIGGVGVARGYLNRPELTAEKFLRDRFVNEPGARMYRTGDLGRWLADGNIEFLGRNDFQVKIRGFRIELGEIEARLLEHSGVREAVVLAREDTPGEKRLVAYYTVADTNRAAWEAPDTEQLRAHLLGLLPEHMVPAAYVRLESLPLSPNGKLDRKALPAPGGDAYLLQAYETPRGEIETRLAGIWAEVLGLDRVGRRDNFFFLGGHSLLAVRVVTRVQQQMGVEVAIRDLFTKPVLADLALAVENSPRAELPPIPRIERTKRLPVAFTSSAITATRDDGLKIVSDDSGATWRDLQTGEVIK